MRSTVGIPLLPAQAVAEGQGGGGCQAVLDNIAIALKKDGTVQIAGFGTFSVETRPARTGRNPRTGEAIKIAAKRTPKFVPGQTLKDALN